ncbi:auxin-responsive protein IAA32-like [Durio zibethinus]|uniref:Auxin-responsive protein n=1 Tax=Durio zibethinus TaxID=66656 RepID=A0A6P5Y3L2_DURZI|nr:auxin-responsive protein IAA32-like [Durio zibethinus]
MDSNASGFLLNNSTLHSVYYQSKEDNGIIDLGLSLRTLQPEAYHPSTHVVGLEAYSDLISWPEANSQLKSSNTAHSRLAHGDCDDEAEGVQSRERWAYAKVNMDGVMVGRKVCMLDHVGYSGLARQLEEMFGSQTVSGLRLFEVESEFSLFYQDKEENWRNVVDVPWKEFVERVKRLRISRKNEALHPRSSSFN